MDNNRTTTRYHENIQKLTKKLKSGNSPPKIRGDGNCQFTALAWWLYGKFQSPNKHLKYVSNVRATIVRVLEEEKEKFQTSFIGDWASYLRIMAKDKTWGDYFTLAAAANYYQLNIQIQYPDKTVYNLNDEEWPESAKKQIYLHYNRGNRTEGNHYEIGSLQVKKEDFVELKNENLVSQLSNFTSDPGQELNWVKRQDWDKVWLEHYKNAEVGIQPEQLNIGALIAEEGKLFYFPDKKSMKSQFEIVRKDERAVEIVREHWNNPTTGLRGVEATFLQLSQKYIGLSRRWVDEQLNKEKGFQEMKPYRKRIIVKPLMMKKPREHWQMDLVDFHRVEYDNVKEGSKSTFKFILTVIDIFSKYAYAVPLINKTEDVVLKGLQDIIEEEFKLSDSQPLKIQSDNGGEFKNEKMTDWLRAWEIEQVFSRSHTPQTNGCVEKFNGTLTKLIHQYWANCETATQDNGKKIKDRSWVEVLPDLLKNYNNTPHSTTKISPSILHFSQNSEQIDRVAARIRIKGKRLLEKRGMKFSSLKTGKKGDYPVKVGDKVRVAMRSLFPNNLGKKHIHVTNWTRRTWQVKQVDREQGLVRVFGLPGAKSAKGWLKINEVQVVNSTFDKVVFTYCKKRNKSSEDIQDMNKETNLERRRTQKELRREETFEDVEVETTENLLPEEPNFNSTKKTVSEEFIEANNPIEVAKMAPRRSKRQGTGLPGKYKDFVDPNTVKISKSRKQKPKRNKKK